MQLQAAAKTALRKIINPYKKGGISLVQLDYTGQSTEVEEEEPDIPPANNSSTSEVHSSYTESSSVDASLTQSLGEKSKSDEENSKSKDSSSLSISESESLHTALDNKKREKSLVERVKSKKGLEKKKEDSKKSSDKKR